MEKIATLFIGDPFLTEARALAVASSLRTKIAGEISSRTCRLSEISLEQVLTEARTLPFLAPAQVFRLRESESLKENQVAVLEKYLQNPFPSSFLIFEAESLPKTSTLVNVIQKYGEVVVLDAREKKAAASRFIREKLKRAGKTMTPQGIALLEERVGDLPEFLDSLLEQLIGYAGGQAQITDSMVEDFEENWKPLDVFTLTDAIAGQKKGEALIFLRRFVEENGTDLISLIGLLHWQLRRFWQARVLLDEGKAEENVLKKCGVSVRQAPFFMRQLKAFSRRKLERAVEGLFQLDWKIKTGRVEGIPAFESWLVETAG